MNAEQWIVFLIIGGIAGWFAGLLMKRRGFGIIGNMILGIIGAFLGSWLFDFFGIAIRGKWVGPLVTATAGALVLLFLIGLIRKK